MSLIDSGGITLSPKHRLALVLITASLMGVLPFVSAPAASAAPYYFNQTSITSAGGVTCYARAEAAVTRSGSTRTVDWITTSACTHAVYGLWITGAVINLLTTVRGPDTTYVYGSNYVAIRGTYTLQNAALVTVQAALNVYDPARGPWVPVTCEGGRPVHMLNPTTGGDCISTVTFNTDWT